MLLPDALTPLMAGLLLVCSTATSFITASLGAGGGVMLLAIMASLLPPAVIIPVHGMVQLGSNFGRAAMTWRAVDWRVIALFLPGVLAGAWLGSVFLVALPPPLWYLTIAAFILYLCWGPPLPKRALGRTGIVIAAVLTTFVSLFVGSTGPLVAAFIKQIHQQRFRTVSTFAVAMTLQHAPKALVFGSLGFVLWDWLPFIGAMILFGVLGTWLGLHMLRRLGDRRFRQAFNLLLTVLALRLAWLAVMEWPGS
ncbi:sulfite exporter TauE/SafE family protein [Marinobacteraceae bacterium S3BR75-40.1]